MKGYSILLDLILLVAIGCVAGQNFVQPERQIKCPAVNQPCEITFRVSYTTTLAPNLFIPGVGFLDFGTPVTLNSSGGYEFDYGSSQAARTRLQPIDGDGISRRPLYVINKQFPGPTVVGYTNQTVRIRVINALHTQALSMHWHGMHQIGTPHMDGAAYITQCPILPNNEFTYEFQLFPEGTFWYHAHLGSERSNGLYGALIVVPPEPSPTNFIDMLGAHTILLDEWFTVNSEEVQQSPIFSPDPLNPNAPYRTNPVPTYDGTANNIPFNGGVINGAGWRYTADSASCRRLANTTLPSFEVTQGNRYRFRVIGSQADQNMRISIQGHGLKLLATDGSNTKTPDSLPQEVDYIIVNVAERYDFIVEANQAIDNYVIMAESMEIPSELESRGYCVKAHRAYAVLRYEGAPSTLPEDFDSQYNPLERCNSTKQCYAINCPFMDYPDNVFTTCINFDELELENSLPVPNNDVGDTVFLNFHEAGNAINARSLANPPSPILSQENDINEGSFCEYSQDLSRDNRGTCLHTYTATTETVEMVLSNVGGSHFSAHPVHIHGHYFHVLHVGYPSYNATTGTIIARNQDLNCATNDGLCDKGVSWSAGAPPPSSCLESGTCPLKDTITIPSGGYVRVRFTRNNPGWWMLHCHIESHFLFGMAMVINTTSAPGNVQIPDNFPRCGHFNSATSSTQPTTQPTEKEDTTYQNATIGIAIVCGALLLMLIIVTSVLVFTCVKQKKQTATEKAATEKVFLAPQEENAKEREQVL
ncbi:uncharacterized protein LOC135341437 [Halichondria panicea]|uniref:uncharacterized protein LOC135341437 n=1 Tax=Halichondria panicea TaxID=6063 RepID=UPI00312BABEB